MKRAAHDFSGIAMNKVFHPVQHGPGGFVCKRRQQNPIRTDAIFQKMCDPVGQGPRLTASRPRKNKKRTTFFCDDPVLFGIQLFFILNH
ncbi:MAG: hypothetical protein BWX99_02486 [Deltaproteobacteria bacterium ADurb.Bin151]|nr:MAG: hypothetical protein BWX99_02486 [Deltaproteobacteria bacterium ADurb.Bin151]